MSHDEKKAEGEPRPRPHPDFDGHHERPFEEWPHEEKLRFLEAMRSMQERVVIERRGVGDERDEGRGG